MSVYQFWTNNRFLRAVSIVGCGRGNQTNQAARDSDGPKRCVSKVLLHWWWIFTRRVARMTLGCMAWRLFSGNVKALRKTPGAAGMVWVWGWILFGGWWVNVWGRWDFGGVGNCCISICLNECISTDRCTHLSMLCKHAPTGSVWWFWFLPWVSTSSFFVQPIFYEGFFPPDVTREAMPMLQTRIAIRACASSLVAFHVMLQGLAHGWSFTPAQDSEGDSKSLVPVFHRRWDRTV